MVDDLFIPTKRCVFPLYVQKKLCHGSYFCNRYSLLISLTLCSTISRSNTNNIYNALKLNKQLQIYLFVLSSTISSYSWTNHKKVMQETRFARQCFLAWRQTKLLCRRYSLLEITIYLCTEHWWSIVVCKENPQISNYVRRLLHPNRHIVIYFVVGISFCLTLSYHFAGMKSRYLPTYSKSRFQLKLWEISFKFIE